MAWECLVKEQRPRLLTHANSAQRACRSTIAADRFAHEQGPAGRWQRTAKVTLSMRHVWFLLLPEHVFCTVANVGKEIPEVGRRLGDGLKRPRAARCGPAVRRIARLVAPL